MRYVNAHPVLAAWLGYGYNMIRWQVFAVPVVLAAKGLYPRIAEFIFAFGLALIATTIISALVPAIGVYQQIGLDPASLPNIEAGAYLEQLRDLPPTRDGTLRHLDLLGLAGIVTFPSFHAASAVLYSWALWGVRWMRPIVVVANGALFLGTPIVGGHYFIDIFAGAAVAVAAIAVSRRVGRMVARRHAGFAAAAIPAVPAECPELEVDPGGAYGWRATAMSRHRSGAGSDPGRRAARVPPTDFNPGAASGGRGRRRRRRHRRGASPAAGRARPPPARRQQQRRLDAVLVEEPQEIGKIFQVHGAVVAHHEGFAIKLGAAVDEGRDADKIEIAAQGVIVEDRSARDAGERLTAFAGVMAAAGARCRGRRWRR